MTQSPNGRNGADPVPGTGTPTPQGNTIPAQGETQDKAPRLPHERDESADSQPGTTDPTTRKMGQLAQADLERGLVDTDRGPVLDAAYDKVREGTPDPVKK